MKASLMTDTGAIYPLRICIVMELPTNAKRGCLWETAKWEACIGLLRHPSGFDLLLMCEPRTASTRLIRTMPVAVVL